MSCLTERERVALDDIFLSISVNESPYEKCKNIYDSFSPLLKEKAKQLTGFAQSRKHLKSYVQIKLFLRSKKNKLRKHLRLSRH